MPTSPLLQLDTGVRRSPFLGLIRGVQASRMSTPIISEPSCRMIMTSSVPDPLRQEIRQFRAQLRDLEQRRDALQVETAALRLWEEAPGEGRVPRWVAEAAIRRRQAEIAELGTEISGLVEQVITLCDRLPGNTHGTPSLELEPIPMPIPQDEATGSTMNRIILSLNRSRSTYAAPGSDDGGYSL